MPSPPLSRRERRALEREIRAAFGNPPDLSEALSRAIMAAPEPVEPARRRRKADTKEAIEHDAG
jgi:hypothetical protein